MCSRSVHAQSGLAVIKHKKNPTQANIMHAAWPERSTALPTAHQAAFAESSAAFLSETTQLRSLRSSMRSSEVKLTASLEWSFPKTVEVRLGQQRHENSIVLVVSIPSLRLRSSRALVQAKRAKGMVDCCRVTPTSSWMLLNVSGYLDNHATQVSGFELGILPPSP